MADGKFHVNKETGRAGACHATKKGCPLGDDTPHFDTKEQAREFIEKDAAQKNEKFGTVSKKKDAPQTQTSGAGSNNNGGKKTVNGAADKPKGGDSEGNIPKYHPKKPLSPMQQHIKNGGPMPGEQTHYDNPEAARAAMENANKNKPLSLTEANKYSKEFKGYLKGFKVDEFDGERGAKYGGRLALDKAEQLRLQHFNGKITQNSVDSFKKDLEDTANKAYASYQKNSANMNIDNAYYDAAVSGYGEVATYNKIIKDFDNLSARGNKGKGEGNIPSDNTPKLSENTVNSFSALKKGLSDRASDTTFYGLTDQGYTIGSAAAADAYEKTFGNSEHMTDGKTVEFVQRLNSDIDKFKSQADSSRERNGQNNFNYSDDKALSEGAISQLETIKEAFVSIQLEEFRKRGGSPEESRERRQNFMIAASKKHSE